MFKKAFQSCTYKETSSTISNKLKFYIEKIKFLSLCRWQLHWRKPSAFLVFSYSLESILWFTSSFLLFGFKKQMEELLGHDRQLKHYNMSWHDFYWAYSKKWVNTFYAWKVTKLFLRFNLNIYKKKCFNDKL